MTTTKKSAPVADKSDPHALTQQRFEEQHQRRIDDLEFRRGLDSRLNKLEH